MVASCYTTLMPDNEVNILPAASQELPPVTPESGLEQPPAMPLSSPSESAPVMVAPVEARPVVAEQPKVDDERTGVLKKVEDVLSDGLKALYSSLPEARRAAFKQKGEQIANFITDMIINGKVKVKIIWKMVGEWLGMISGVNKYFLEQEVKIKTERLMEYAKTVHA